MRPGSRAGRCLWWLPLAWALTLALGPAAAGEAQRADGKPSRVAAIGEHVTRLPSGLFEVEVPGGDLLTHGPDPLALRTRRSETRATSFGFGLGDAERPPVCATDFYQHVLYARSETAPDRYAQAVPQIRSSIRRMNAVLNRDAADSGGGSADYKVLCQAGEIRVDALTAPGSDFESIVTAAKSAGFDAPNADYTIFSDERAGYCGIASYQADERLLNLNRSNNGGGYAVTYRDCWLTETPMHENGHNQGAVQYLAPNSTGTGGHCYDEFDVMCYSPDGGDRHQGGAVSRCQDRVHFDCGYDDYFDAAPEPGEYLEGSWNIGSALNQFIVFGLPAPPSAPMGGTGEPSARRPVRLRNGVAARAGAAPAGGWRYFVQRVPRGTRTLRVTLAPRGCRPAACAADLDLYLLRGARPELRRFDCRAAGPGPSERCRLRLPLSGRWYAGVYTASGSGKFKLKAVARG